MVNLRQPLGPEILKGATQTSYIQENHRDIRNRESLPLKDSYVHSFAPEPRAKAAACKAPRPYVKETHCNGERTRWRGRNLRALSLGMEARADVNRALPSDQLPLLGAGSHSPSRWLAPRGTPTPLAPPEPGGEQHAPVAPLSTLLSQQARCLLIAPTAPPKPAGAQFAQGMPLKYSVLLTLSPNNWRENFLQATTRIVLHRYTKTPPRFPVKKKKKPIYFYSRGTL